MTRTIGYSTGALAFGDFRCALDILGRHAITAVELPALREPELAPLSAAAADLDLSQFEYIAVHAPSAIEPDSESEVVRTLYGLSQNGWPIVVHPDAIQDYSLWRRFGPLLCVENMDKRKPVARTVTELRSVFEMLPDARFCFDLGHARQVDPSMTEAYFMLRNFQSRLCQVHVSEVNTCRRHDRLSYASVLAFRKIAEYVPEGVPLIIEAVLAEVDMQSELDRVQDALPVADQVT